MVITIFSIFLGIIYYLSFLWMGDSWTFLDSTVGFILAVPELTPNMGLFWYFFTEMFEHFRVFFVCTFQINCFVYVYPLASRLKNQVTMIENILLSYEVYAPVCLFVWVDAFHEGRKVGVPLGILPHVLGLALVTPPNRSYCRSPSVPGLEQTFLTPRPVQS